MSLGLRAFTRRTLILSTAAALLAMGVVAGAPLVAPAEAQSGGSSELEGSLACPAMTDSIDRAFDAYFNREPTASEFIDIATRYKTGQLNLEQIAEQLVTSDEFNTRYGTLSDDRYISLVYRNTLGRQPTDTEQQFWTNSLGTGHPRGAMMIAFSESAEFVDQTDTATPLAGYLNWYPEGTQWHCGVGPREALSIKPLEDEAVYADFAFFNGGVEQSPVDLFTVLGTRPHIEVTSGSLPSGFTSYKWGGLFNGDGNYGTAITINALESTSWIVVFYPSSIGEQRLGWEIEL